MRRAPAILLVSAYCALLVFAVLVAPRARLRPVAIAGGDILIGAEEPLSIAFRVLDARTGRPVEGVGLLFHAPRLAGVAAGELTAVTDGEGTARVEVPREGRAAGGDALGFSEERVAVTLADPRGFLLASPWPGARPAERRAIADVLVAEPKMRFLLVDLDGLARTAAGWPRLPPAALLERTEAECRLRGRVIYLASLDEMASQKTKLWLEASGMPDGLLLVRPPAEPKAVWLKNLERRLRALEADADLVLCGSEDAERYTGAFEGLKASLYGG